MSRPAQAQLYTTLSHPADRHYRYNAQRPIGSAPASKTGTTTTQDSKTNTNNTNRPLRSHPTRTETSHKSVQDAIKQIDDRLQQLSDRILPTQPYLLSVPTDSPYRFDRRFLNTWYVGTPFGPHEEQLQYMSFHPHQGPTEDLLKVVGEWSDESGNPVEDDFMSQTQTLSGPNTPVSQPTRKKISLKDYKPKDKTKPTEPGVPTPTVAPPLSRQQQQQQPQPQSPRSTVKSIKSSGSSSTMRADVRDSTRRVEDQSSRMVTGTVRKPITTERSERPDAKLPGHKSLPAKPPTVKRQPDVPSPPKRRRLSSEESGSDDEHPQKDRSSDARNKHKAIPTLLSPIPSITWNTAERSLPRLLTPDLPPALEKLLAGDQTPVPKRSDFVRTTLANALTSPAAPKKASDRPADNGRNRSDSQLSSKGVVPGERASPHIKPLAKNESQPPTPVQQPLQQKTVAPAAAAAPTVRQRRVIVLKYGKKNRFRVEGLLKFASRPNKAKMAAAALTAPEMTRAVSNSTLSTTSSTKADRKRAAEVSPERPAKKAKPLLQTPERSRPAQTATKSPAVRAKIDVQSTPRRDLKTSAMQRIASSDGYLDVKTPPIDRGRVSTPVHTRESPITTGHAGSGGGGASATPTTGGTDRAGWVELKTKYFNLGRTIKREGQNLSNSRSDTDQMLGAVYLIEALLCFMINLSADSLSRPGTNTDPGWQTIMPYHIFVFKQTRKYRLLHGLVIQLGAVCRQILNNHNIDRLSRDPLPTVESERDRDRDRDAGVNSAPTPGSDGNTRNSGGAGGGESSTLSGNSNSNNNSNNSNISYPVDSEKYKRRYLEFRNDLVLNSKELQSAWLEGSRYLSPPIIEKEFPRTWSTRSKDLSARATTKPTPTKVVADGHLVPLDACSTAWEAMRFGLVMMDEWCEINGVQWRTRITL